MTQGQGYFQQKSWDLRGEEFSSFSFLGVFCDPLTVPLGAGSDIPVTFW